MGDGADDQDGFPCGGPGWAGEGDEGDQVVSDEDLDD